MVYYFVEELASASALCGCDGSPLHVHGSWFMGEQAHSAAVRDGNEGYGNCYMERDARPQYFRGS